MKATAPASSANLGPGFDCLALALELRCSVVVTSAREWSIESSDGGRLLSLARQMSPEPLAVEIDSDIPVGRGLGSSAAVLSALMAAIRRHTGADTDRHELFGLVSEAEGHPDNAAAAVYGGLVHTSGGRVHTLDLHPSLIPVVAVPDVSLSTPEARDALPAMVPLELAARTVSRVVLLIEGLRTGDQELLAAVGGDELHEPYRIGLRPVIGDLVGAAREAGAAFAAISGSGPSVLAMTTVDRLEQVSRAFEKDGLARVLTPAVAQAGVL